MNCAKLDLHVNKTPSERIKTNAMYDQIKSSKAKHKKKHKKKGSKSKSKKKGGGDNPLDVMSGDDLKDGDLIISSENEIDNIDDNKDDIEIKSESD